MLPSCYNQTGPDKCSPSLTALGPEKMSPSLIFDDKGIDDALLGRLEPRVLSGGSISCTWLPHQPGLHHAFANLYTRCRRVQAYSRDDGHILNETWQGNARTDTAKLAKIMARWSWQRP